MESQGRRQEVGDRGCEALMFLLCGSASTIQLYSKAIRVHHSDSQFESEIEVKHSAIS